MMRDDRSATRQVMRFHAMNFRRR
ncbi:MAG: hypothetical protein JWN40_5616, partial [Phycisphaerales bacterium]|nr:hypothetical protein [Phycisphaerales bacterium]